MSIKQTKKLEQQEAQQELRKLLRGIDTIRTSAEWTGSTAYVRLFIVKNNELIDITHQAGKAMDDKTVHPKLYGFKRGGYGYGREFDVAYGLGHALYPKGYKHTAKGCHSNDHVNHGSLDNTYHKDGGYRFRQSSI